MLTAPHRETVGSAASTENDLEIGVSDDAEQRVDTRIIPPSMLNQPRRQRRRRRTGAVAATVVAVVVAACGIASVLLRPIHHAHPPNDAARITSSTAVTPPPAFADGGDCAASTLGNVVTGNGPGGTANGASAILALQHAFYVDRAGAAVRAVVEEGALGFSSADKIQAGIDTVPPGTMHCLMIREDGPDQYFVEVTERRPGNLVTIYRQAITTAAIDGRILIHSYTALE